MVYIKRRIEYIIREVINLMAKLLWDQTGQKTYQTGVDRGVLFPMAAGGTYEKGVAWNGLTKVSESPDGGDATAKYANNGKYLNLIAKESFKGSISAYTYPDEFAACLGEVDAVAGVKLTAQTRKSFGFAYRTLIGNDTESTGHGYLINLVYNATAGVASKDFETINDSPDAIEFSWDFTTTPVDTGVDNTQSMAHIIIDSTKLEQSKLKKVEEAIYGTDSSDAKLPTPKELMVLLGVVTG